MSKANYDLTLTLEQWPIEKVIPYARNARKIPQSAINKVAGSIKEFGWRQPIVVDSDGVISWRAIRGCWLLKNSG